MRNRSVLRRAFLGGLAAASSGLAAGWLVSLFDSDAQDDRPMPNPLLKKLRVRPKPDGGGGGNPPVDPGTFAATHTLGVGRLTMGQAIPKGQVPAGQSLAFSGLPTQFDLKTTWDDGSARFAILSADVASAGAYPLAVGGPATGTFSPTIPTASVTLTIGGVAYTATLPASVSSDPWLSGPICREWRHVVTPKTSGNASHPFLRVIFDVRCYAAGGSRVDVTVENCLDLASTATVTYDASISVAGSTVFSQAGVVHYYFARWRKAFLSGMAESAPTLDWAPAIAAKAVPKILATVADRAYAASGPGYGIMERGEVSFADMGGTGGRPEIAPYPDWAARFLLRPGSTARSATLRTGDLAGSWPVHARNADGSFVSIDSRPNYWLDYRNGDSAFSMGDYPPGPLKPEQNHVPSLAYIPYLATGDRYHADEMADWGHFALLGTWPAAAGYGVSGDDGRGGSQGIVGAAQVRGRAWNLRNLADAAAYLPDAHPAKSYFAAKVEANLAFYDAYAANHVTPFGSFFEVAASGYSAINLWRNNYLAWAIDRAVGHGFGGGAGHAFRDRNAAFQLKLFTSEPDYPRDWAGPIGMAVGTDSGSGPTFYATMAQMYAGTYAILNGNRSDLGSNYGIDARLMLHIARGLGLAGAQGAIDYLDPLVAPKFASTDQLAWGAGWAIDGSA